MLLPTWAAHLHAATLFIQALKVWVITLAPRWASKIMAMAVPLPCRQWFLHNALWSPASSNPATLASYTSAYFFIYLAWFHFMKPIQSLWLSDHGVGRDLLETNYLQVKANAWNILQMSSPQCTNYPLPIASAQTEFTVKAVDTLSPQRKWIKGDKQISPWWKHLVEDNPMLEWPLL